MILNAAKFHYITLCPFVHLLQRATSALHNLHLFSPETFLEGSI